MSTEQSATDRQPLDLAALKALADAATPGPWRAEPGAVNLPGDKNPWPSDYVAPIDSNGSLRGSRFKVPTEADAKFIATARAALPALIEAYEAEQEESDVLRGRMADLLTGTANALKGTPDALTWHDWSDLPAVAQHLKHAVTVRNVAVRDAGLLREAAEAERDEARTEVQRLRELRDAAKIFRRAIESSLGFAVATGAIDALVDAVDALTEPEEPTNV